MMSNTVPRSPLAPSVLLLDLVETPRLRYLISLLLDRAVLVRVGPLATLVNAVTTVVLTAQVVVLMTHLLLTVGAAGVVVVQLIIFIDNERVITPPVVSVVVITHHRQKLHERVLN